jgi:hypothetical protein
MNRSAFFAFIFSIVGLGSVLAQPASEGPMPSRAPVEDALARRAAYLARVAQVIDWRASGGRAQINDPAKFDLAGIAAKLVRGEDFAGCSARVIALMKDPGTGPFWMFPVVCVAYLGRDKLSPEARASIRDVWRTTRQLRGDVVYWQKFRGESRRVTGVSQPVDQSHHRSGAGRI